MTDFLAGQTLTPLHFPPTVEDVEVDTFGFTITTFGTAASSGTYNDCGVAFTAPTSGRVTVTYSAIFSHSTSDTAAVEMAPVVRTGGTVGSGTSVVAAGDANKIRKLVPSNDGLVTGERSILVTGLTPGDTYNVRLEHRVSGGTGSLRSRLVRVAPAT